MTDEELDLGVLRVSFAGDPGERRAAARRLDERALREVQVNREDFERKWELDSSGT
ncbi:hypothetical protein ACFY8C_31660 [Streptomyces flavochromogenes]|uniref:Uncharacterized protein n=1 Tax=Streptomyces flavochromogenes TaxID=68199 RepID=A0ABW6XZB1_9ACTN|nr:hypothetical protein [Streptomyces flavochromogenes]